MGSYRRNLLASGAMGTSGQEAFTTGGSYTFTVPAGVTAICILTVGGGGGGGRGSYYIGGCGGGGGGLSYSNNVVVTPGENLTVVVGTAGLGGIPAGPNRNTRSSSPGGDSFVRRGTTDLVKAKGGAEGHISPSSTEPGGAAMEGIGDVKYSGGAGRKTSGRPGMGGGAAGYSGNGGDAGFYPNTNAPPGGGGAGASNKRNVSYGGNGGGGIGIIKEGKSGIVTLYTTSSGGVSGGGSGGQDGAEGGYHISGNGGAYGGGGGGGDGGGGDHRYRHHFGGIGGVGAVRIIWGTARSYPNNSDDVI